MTCIAYLGNHVYRRGIDRRPESRVFLIGRNIVDGDEKRAIAILPILTISVEHGRQREMLLKEAKASRSSEEHS